jgi:hypothetical protein
MKLSLRELFLLVALAAMGCGWWVDRTRTAADRARVARDFDDLRDRYKKLDARYDEVVAGKNRSPSTGFTSGATGYSTSLSPTFIQPNDGR